MRSPAEQRRQRVSVERALRGLAALGLAAGLWLAWWPRLRPAGGPGALHVTFTAAPSPVQRDSLAAVQRSGRPVSWSGAAGATIASVEALREPGNRWRVSVVADTAVALRDSLGLLDSLPSGVGSLGTDAVRGALRVDGALASASLLAPAAVSLRPVLVLGRATWESRFVTVALEEAGWKVDAVLTVGRERDVAQGVTMPSATRHAAIVVLDSASLRANAVAIERAVRAGTGVVLAGEAAANTPALRGIAAASVTGRVVPEARRLDGIPALEALPRYTLVPRTPQSTVLDQRDGQPAVIARRVYAGRVIHLGYTDTWRWRMEGEGRGPAEHRAYWSRVVGLVADPTAAAVSRDPLAFADPAPRAALVQALGPARDDLPPSPAQIPPLPAWLGALLLALLVAEWASRRARGAP